MSWIQKPGSISVDSMCTVVMCCSDTCFVNCQLYDPYCHIDYE